MLRERMREAGVLPNEVTYNALLDLHRFDVQEVNPFTLNPSPRPHLTSPSLPHPHRLAWSR